MWRARPAHCAFALLCALPSAAVQAVVIDFDDGPAPCGFASTVAVRSEYSGLGVEFSAPVNDGGAILDECSNFFVTGYSAPNFLAFNTAATLMDGGIPRHPETIFFTVPYPRSVRFLAGSSSGGALAADAFDAGDTLVASRWTNLSDTMATVFLASAGGIAKIVLNGPTRFIVDDLDVSPLPCGEAAACKPAGKSLLLLRNEADDGKDKILFKWLHGDATSLGELGTPAGTSDYALCVYAGGEAATVDLPGGAHWKPLGSDGFKYRDPSGWPRAVIKSGAAGRAKALVKGKGAGLPDDLVPALSLPVVAVVVNKDDGVCFRGEYDTPDVRKNDAGVFKAKAQ